MEKSTIVNLLTNSGLKVIGMDDKFIYLQDPACLLPAFDVLLHYAWIVVLILIGIMLFGWGVLYIRNGVKLDSVFSNAKSLLLILAVLALVKPIVNFVYGDNLFGKQCDTKNVSLSVVQDLLKQREKKFGNEQKTQLYETFDVIDSGIIDNEKN